MPCECCMAQDYWSTTSCESYVAAWATKHVLRSLGARLRHRKPSTQDSSPTILTPSTRCKLFLVRRYLGVVVRGGALPSCDVRSTGENSRRPVCDFCHRFISGFRLQGASSRTSVSKAKDQDYTLLRLKQEPQSGNSRKASESELPDFSRS